MTNDERVFVFDLNETGVGHLRWRSKGDPPRPIAMTSKHFSDMSSMCIEMLHGGNEIWTEIFRPGFVQFVRCAVSLGHKAVLWSCSEDLPFLYRTAASVLNGIDRAAFPDWWDNTLVKMAGKPIGQWLAIICKRTFPQATARGEKPLAELAKLFPEIPKDRFVLYDDNAFVVARNAEMGFEAVDVPPYRPTFSKSYEEDEFWFREAEKRFGVALPESCAVNEGWKLVDEGCYPPDSPKLGRGEASHGKRVEIMDSR